MNAEGNDNEKADFELRTNTNHILLHILHFETFGSFEWKSTDVYVRLFVSLQRFSKEFSRNLQSGNLTDMIVYAKIKTL